jgi:hypothetical protein
MPITFSARCPYCKHLSLQYGYSREGLEQLITESSDIDGYCVSCDRHWDISLMEWAEIARALFGTTLYN